MTEIRIIDAHNHVGGLAGWGIGDPDADQSDLAEDIAVRLGLLDDKGVSDAIIIASHDYVRPDGILDNQRVNDALAVHRDACDRFVGAVGIVEPLNGERGLAEVDRCRDLGFVGISFHARNQGVSTDSPWIRRYLERMGELGLVPFIHCVGESSSEALWKVDVLAGDFPDLKILVLDVFSTFEQSQFVQRVAERRENLSFDTALAHGLGFVRMLIDRCGAHRVVYGSDLYSTKTGLHLELGDVLDQLLASDLSDADKAAICAGNITTLLNLDREVAP